jgi:hypothetical protein
VNLIDLKIPKKTKKELKEDMGPSTLGSQEQYPYGMRLTFGTDQMPKFPQLEKVKVGEKVGIQGIGEIMEVRKVDRQGDKDQFSIEIQIQKVGIKPGSSKKDDTLIGAIEKAKKGQLK